MNLQLAPFRGRAIETSAPSAGLTGNQLGVGALVGLAVGINPLAVLFVYLLARNATPSTTSLGVLRARNLGSQVAQALRSGGIPGTVPLPPGLREALRRFQHRPPAEQIREFQEIQGGRQIQQQVQQQIEQLLNQLLQQTLQNLPPQAVDAQLKALMRLQRVAQELTDEIERKLLKDLEELQEEEDEDENENENDAAAAKTATGPNDGGLEARMRARSGGARSSAKRGAGSGKAEDKEDEIGDDAPTPDT
jgi:hypothetical protein